MHKRCNREDRMLRVKNGNKLDECEMMKFICVRARIYNNNCRFSSGIRLFEDLLFWKHFSGLIEICVEKCFAYAKNEYI